VNIKKGICTSEILNELSQVPENNTMELILKLECSCKLGLINFVEENLAKLISFGYKLEEIKKYTKLRNSDITNCLISNSKFLLDLALMEENFEVALQNDTAFVLINSIYELDQNSRKIALRVGDRSIIRTIDSINHPLVTQLILSKRTNFIKLGKNAEDKFYLVCLHLFRNLDNDQYQVLREALLDKIKRNQFSPYSFANIIDERLRFNNDPTYPQYNFLRKEIVNDQKIKEIQLNRRAINCY
jgi:hypothetical protein